ncbi:CAP domain-containing protein [Streptomyces sp. NPDC001544]|uniref:CAP domain-containing protein n=1 Tax=Streptomyces sp. NPDC001544 TaxID=3364584 RepID=UPI00367B182D
MGKHRKKQHYRRIVVAAAVVGAVGVPSVAMACSDWGVGDGTRLSSAPADIAGTPLGLDSAPTGLDSGAPAGLDGTPADAFGTPANKAEQWRRTDGHRHWKGHRIRHRHGAPTAPPASPAPVASPSTTAAPKPTTPKPAGTSAAPAAPSTPKATATASGATARVIELVNAERAKVGCPALTPNATLTKVAQAHSADMAAHQNMSHTGSDGSSPGDRLTSAGYDWSAYGENVAYGYSTPEQVMAGWMASPGHRANILNCSFKEIGVGLAQPDSYWTQDFGTAR